jgi:cbb3-type cytochrome oxidase subunit 3
MSLPTCSLHETEIAFLIALGFIIFLAAVASIFSKHEKAEQDRKAKQVAND